MSDMSNCSLVILMNCCCCIWFSRCYGPILGPFHRHSINYIYISLSLCTVCIFLERGRRGKESDAAYLEETLRYSPGSVERKPQKTFNESARLGNRTPVSRSANHQWHGAMNPRFQDRSTWSPRIFDISTMAVDVQNYTWQSHLQLRTALALTCPNY